jgi:hypothetical protein
VLGGPLYRFYLRTRMAREPLELFVRRMIIIPLICWLPLSLLAGLQGRLTGGVRAPFLFDPDVHVRLLAALPLLIGAEVLVHQRMRLVVTLFLERGIVAEEDRPRFLGLVDSGRRLSNSVWFELFLLAFVFTAGHWIWTRNVSLSVSTWYALKDGAETHLTAAGYWYAFVSLPIFRFMLYRWYYRLFIWYRFLWQVRGLPLHLNLYHPDRAGGLSFLSASTQAIALVMVAQSVAFAGIIFERILYAGAKLPSFKIEIVGWTVFMLLLTVFPLGFFVIQLDRAGRVARRELGSLASRYVNDFRRKWVQDAVHADEALLGTPDIQSMSDLANSYSVVTEVRLFPLTKQALIRLVIMIGLPFLPLTLTMFKLDEMVGRIFKFIF